MELSGRSDLKFTRTSLQYLVQFHAQVEYSRCICRHAGGIWTNTPNYVEMDDGELYVTETAFRLEGSCEYIE